MRVTIPLAHLLGGQTEDTLDPRASPGPGQGLHLPGVLWVHPARGPPGGSGRPERGQPEARKQAATVPEQTWAGAWGQGTRGQCTGGARQARGHLHADG